MDFRRLMLDGAWAIESEPSEDERGAFVRLWCADEFEAHGITDRWVQSSFARNARAGTLRGLHYQAAPYEEAKLVRCSRGAIYDVIVDLRPRSKTYLRWTGVELSAGNRRQVYVPRGFAHGYQSLTDDTEVCYSISAPYRAEAARGVRWDDPALGIEWPPAECRCISERDRSFPDLKP